MGWGDSPASSIAPGPQCGCHDGEAPPALHPQPPHLPIPASPTLGVTDLEATQSLLPGGLTSAFRMFSLASSICRSTAAASTSGTCCRLASSCCSTWVGTGWVSGVVGAGRGQGKPLLEPPTMLRGEGQHPPPRCAPCFCGPEPPVWPSAVPPSPGWPCRPRVAAGTPERGHGG